MPSKGRKQEKALQYDFFLLTSFPTLLCRVGKRSTLQSRHPAEGGQEGGLAKYQFFYKISEVKIGDQGTPYFFTEKKGFLRNPILKDELANIF